MFNRRTSKLLLSASSLVLIGLFLTGCEMKPSSKSHKGQAVTSLIEIAMQPDSLIDKDKNKAQYDVREFDIYKNTQAQIVKSPFVLTAALRKPEISSLSIYKQHENDPISWLQNNIEVSFPGDAEIMKVSLYDLNKEEAVKMLRAVVDAYLTEIIETQKNMKARELAAIDEVLTSKQRQIRQRRTTVKALAEELGTVDKDALKLQLQDASQQLALYRQQLFQVESEIRRLTAEREIVTASLNRLKKRDNLKDAKVDNVRPELQRVAKEMVGLANQLSQVVAKLSDVELSHRLQNDLMDVRQQIEGWQKLLGVQLAGYGRAELREEIANLDIRINLAKESEAKLKEEVDRQKEEFKRIGQSSVEIEMMLADLKNLEEVVRKIVTKRESLDIEMKGRPRIRLLQRAELPR